MQHIQSGVLDELSFVILIEYALRLNVIATVCIDADGGATDFRMWKGLY